MSTGTNEHLSSLSEGASRTQASPQPDRTAPSKRRYVIGIGGGTGAGKSTLANLLRSRYAAAGVSVLDFDSYYQDRSHLNEEARVAINYDEPYAIDHDLLLQHLTQLIKGASITKPQYCFATHSRMNSCEVVQPASLILLEGIFALWEPRIRAVMDIKVYVDAGPDIRFIRRLRRDLAERGRSLDSVITQYLDLVRPMHYAFIQPTKSFADVVVNDAQTLQQLIGISDRMLSQTESCPLVE